MALMGELKRQSSVHHEKGHGDLPEVLLDLGGVGDDVLVIRGLPMSAGQHLSGAQDYVARPAVAHGDLRYQHSLAHHVGRDHHHGVTRVRA